jgi:hypothetical protein
MATVTKGASRAKRRVKSGFARIKHLKRAGHRKARRTSKVSVNQGKEDEVFEKPEVTAWDVC